MTPPPSLKQLFNLKAILTRQYHIPYSEYLGRVLQSLTLGERAILWILTAIFALSAFSLMLSVQKEGTTEVPVRGGSIKEGVIGAPRFINPLLAQTDTDRDLTMLVYSGLMRPSDNGTLIPDLAERYSVSEDGKTYTFVLRADARFHDGTPVTADDVVFTIARAQDPAIKSIRRADWEGVTVKKVNDHEITFTLPHSYAPFLENATMGILPRHIWANITAQEFPFSTFNTEPIGSGPFEIKSISENKSGIPSRYTLKAFDRYTLGRPYLDTVTMRFYSNEDDLVRAYEAGTVTSVSGVSAQRINDILRSDSRILHVTFPRIFAVFFNQNQNHALADKAVRQALSVLVDKQGLIDSVLHGYGTVIHSPLPPNTVTGQHVEKLPPHNANTALQEAQDVLANAGWKYDEEQKAYTKNDKVLSLTIATSNAFDLKRSADMIATAWNAAGIPTKVAVFETGDLNQSVIRPRAYDALLFGQIVGRGLDLFPFWHSSQKDDPGLNIASYTNTKADDLLEKARSERDKGKRDELYVAFEEEIMNDIPAIFLYAPDFLYVIPQDLRGAESLVLITTPSERFVQVHKWYTQTKRVWNVLAPNN